MNVMKNAEAQGKDVTHAHELLKKDQNQLEQYLKDEKKLKDFRSTIAQEKVKADEKLSHIRANQEHSNNQRIKQDIVNDLRQEFVGVIERVSELIVPTSMANSAALNT